MAQSTRGTVAFVDYAQVFTNFYKTKLANDQVKQMHASYLELRVTFIEELNGMLEKYKRLRDQSIDENLTKEKRDAFRRDAENMLGEIRQQEKKVKRHDEAYEAKVIEQRKRIRLRYGNEIKERIHGYAKSKGYAAIIDHTIVTGESAPGVLYYNEDSDITTEVIKEINK